MTHSRCIAAALAAAILAGCATQPELVYPEQAEGVECSLAFDVLAEQIGSPHRTCRPGPGAAEPQA